MRSWLSVYFTDARSKKGEDIQCYLHSNSLSNKMDNSLLAVRDINHKYIVVEGRNGTDENRTGSATDRINHQQYPLL